MPDAPFRIVITPANGSAFPADDEHNSRLLLDVVRAAVRVEYGPGADVRRIRHAEPPSRFNATPAEVDQFLRFHFAEDTLLRFEQAVGNRVVTEAAKDIRLEAAARNVSPVTPQRINGWTDAANHVDPLKGGGHYPSLLIDFERN